MGRVGMHLTGYTEGKISLLRFSGILFMIALLLAGQAKMRCTPFFLFQMLKSLHVFSTFICSRKI